MTVTKPPTLQRWGIGLRAIAAPEALEGSLMALPDAT